ncbi:DedA family protein [Cytophagaceae bacterium DM2B3-1]|uniref:DedA family protein n=1 Tax=Xanthocytophaga flava TaxID=3048013 RepID=A0ABT7CJM8_9BACT|nr:DedA family protein [Xanthocytophaga flavus]MDJ1468351.1 DedA family protein [Xanthocytophaga flavus]MDJ1493237.1 DedA family protein [Xanthocytophaga flavus]
MEIIKQLIDFILHIDKHLAELISDYGTLTYIILFVIIFVETGLVVMPFLPGDSLLFAAGAFAAFSNNEDLNIYYLLPLLFTAAFLGDTVNYIIGKYIGPKAFSGKIKFLKKEYLDQTQAFFDKHGGKSIIYARFVPIVRTFAPFVAGVGSMNYGKFISYNIIGGLIWVIGLTLAGYFFGGISIIKDNFEKVIILIILISILPPVIEYVRHRFVKKAA